MKARAIVFLFMLLLTNPASYSQPAAGKLQSVPRQWWIGMNYNKVLLVISGSNLQNGKATVSYPGVSIISQYDASNKSHFFLELEISKSALPGSFPILISKGNTPVGSVNFELKARQYNYLPKKISGADAVYQIVPDRFVNANPLNDNLSGMYEPADRSNPSGVHGGDIAGISKALPYLKELGITAIELTPLYESNQFVLSYERFSPTSHYDADPRIGTLEEIKNTINQYRDNNIKVILTAVLHKAGNQHPLAQNPPQNDWIVKRDGVALEKPKHFLYADSYASPEDIDRHASIWESFDIPSFNQNSQELRRYLVQHLIWWVETLHPDGLKIDHSQLNTTAMLSEATNALKADFPKLNLISAPATNNVVHNWYWMTGIDKFKFTHLTDAPLNMAFSDSFAEFTRSSDALKPIYETLASDVIYGDAPNKMMFFGDDHRSSRLFTLAEKDPAIFKIYMGFLLTTRGIPAFLYGTELLQEGYVLEGNGFVRRDFPGGWDKDISSAFDMSSLTNQQREAHKFISAILQWRRDNPEVMEGSMVHFEPIEDVYAYIREGQSKKLLVLINNHPSSPRRIGNTKFASSLGQSITVKNIVTGDMSSGIGNLILSHKSILILEISEN